MPAIFLCGFVYYKDRIEKEPIGLLALLFAAGAAVYMPVMAIERLISGVFDKLFASYIVFGADGATEYSSGIAEVLHLFFVSFFAVALVEILIKWCVLYFCTRNNKHFNYLFDGIVYSVFISLGFAACENLRFAWINGWDTLVLHSISSVPMHLFVGIFMGYYFSRWNSHKRAKELEELMYKRHLIEKEKMSAPWKRLVLSFALPMLICGTSLFAGSIDTAIVRTLFYFAVFSLFGISFISIDRISSADSPSKKFSEKLLKEKHPELDASVWDALERIREEK